MHCWPALPAPAPPPRLPRTPHCAAGRSSCAAAASPPTLTSPVPSPLRIVRAFLIEEQKIVKKVLKTQAAAK